MDQQGDWPRHREDAGDRGCARRHGEFDSGKPNHERANSPQLARGLSQDIRRDGNPCALWGKAEDLAALAVFLASPLARYIAGAVIPMDSGLRRYQF